MKNGPRIHRSCPESGRYSAPGHENNRKKLSLAIEDRLLYRPFGKHSRKEVKSLQFHQEGNIYGKGKPGQRRRRQPRPEERRSYLPRPAPQGPRPAAG